MAEKQNTPGGIIHTYQKFDPLKFPSPNAPDTDLTSPAFEHLLEYGSLRELTDEELARAVKIDPSMLPRLGPSIETLMAILQERKRKILATYETKSVQLEAGRKLFHSAQQANPPAKLADRFRRAVEDEQLHELENLWYHSDEQSPFAGKLLGVVERMGEKYQVDELAAKYEFTGRTKMSVPQALEIKEELETIDKLLKQLEEAAKTAQIGIIDMDELSRFAEPGDMEELGELRQQIEDLVREMAEQQGLLRDSAGSYQLTPKAYRLFQGRILNEIFSQLQQSRSGRHQGPIVGEGAVEMQRTKPYEFGDSVANMDVPGTFVNAMIRNGPGLPVKIHSDDIEIHRTRNNPKCATCVLLDMSGSMRYGGLYVNVKRMGLALEGLIHKEYPGDFLQFIEMYTFAKPRPFSEIAMLMPKPVTIFSPRVALKADMSNPEMSEYGIPPHFTNIQHGLQLSRSYLAAQDTPNRQIIVITDGLPTAHFEKNILYMLYPPDVRTEEATMREALLCQSEQITINIFLLQSWNQTSEDIQFAYRLARTTSGRVFFTAGKDLDRFVVWDYLSHRRTIIT